jgi:hypothetical protein
MTNYSHLSDKPSAFKKFYSLDLALHTVISKVCGFKVR